MDDKLYFILIACFGGICQEILHWYELRNKLDTEENKKLFSSKFYWLLTFLMIVTSGIGTWILFYDEGNPYKPKIPFILGAAFPVLFKKVVATLQTRDLGISKKGEYNLEDVTKKYFL